MEYFIGSTLAWMLVLLINIGTCEHIIGDVPVYEDTYQSDWNKDWAMLSGRVSKPYCIDIPKNMSLCQGIGYSQMRLPNLLDHDTVREVTAQAAAWNHLLGIRCHPDTKIFLCSLFTPVCLDRPIWPCRTLCESVQQKCVAYMEKYGYPWPDMLRCDKFPMDNDLCIQLQNSDKPDEKVCPPCNRPDTFEGIVDNYCSAEFVVKMKVNENLILGNDVKLIADKKKKVYKKDGLKKKDLRQITTYIEAGRQCECPILDDLGELDYVLAMGHKRGDQLILSFVQLFNRKAPALRRALKAIRKENICAAGLEGLNTKSEQKASNKKKSRKNRRRGSKKSRNEDRSRKRDRSRSERENKENGENRRQVNRRNDGNN